MRGHEALLADIFSLAMSLDMRRAQGRDQAGPVAAGSTFGLARCSHRRFYRVLNPRAGRLWPRSILTALPHVKNEVSSPTINARAQVVHFPHRAVERKWRVRVTTGRLGTLFGMVCWHRSLPYSALRPRTRFAAALSPLRSWRGQCRPAGDADWPPSPGGPPPRRHWAIMAGLGCQLPVIPLILHLEAQPSIH